MAIQWLKKLSGKVSTAIKSFVSSGPENKASAAKSRSNSKSEASRKKSKSIVNAQIILSVPPGQPCILKLEEVWELDLEVAKKKNFRVQDLVVTLIFHTHGMEGVRQLQTLREHPNAHFDYGVKMYQAACMPGGKTKHISILRRKNIIRPAINQKWAINYFEMWMDFQVWPDGTWSILSSSLPDVPASLASPYMVEGFWDMIASIRQKDVGKGKGKTTYITNLV